ncbi:ASCH domain-containing protein [Acinetobacter dispersus]|uniref:ASCH domain-containing protein n=1 Tax=Acinetobacter dispersus TaxID=70348 RepID=UPI001F4B42EC|nr:ASCH domain-containing protein [Acinetobacter dispersus]MCH7384750.1 ASCH domain-containing protein [Acinetobacter dispersus]
MLKQYTALSIVAPNAERIAKKIKTLEVRSWQPEMLPLKELIIVENQNFLLSDGDEEVGFAVALVDIESVHPWRSDEVDAACATYWAEGYFAWVIGNIRPIDPPIQIIAKRKLYLLELDIG